MKSLLRIVLVVAAVSGSILTTGCSILQQDRRDAPWDPKRGQTLFDQIPNWEGGANRVCGGHLTEEERQRTGRSPRC
jgi:hypothetical protein